MFGEHDFFEDPEVVHVNLGPRLLIIDKLLNPELTIIVLDVIESQISI